MSINRYYDEGFANYAKYISKKGGISVQTIKPYTKLTSDIKVNGMIQW